MIKLIALYKHPENKEAFMDYYINTHIPLVHKIPGLAKVEVRQITDTFIPGADTFFLMAEMSFPDRETFDKALRSPEQKAAGKDVQNFAAGLVSLMVADEL
ncbi:EthD family reductase [Kordiimonas pumila]|uniref:EthD family reductase n=1 Tax=Kordiimonas pumila TaxID=2161677 RepID=A0ABV7D4W4_9PROT|nr:EthD family reductase [Kordiimonas pumila]